ncbi:1-deoxy-D-xylulose-5-phosphate synthase [bacterium]|jgi:1-deoxy-D-xylulose-5-phosphate synthase|nr:1-deoxy-D-xylulose-5-phosphate synthase [bacterium]
MDKKSLLYSLNFPDDLKDLSKSEYEQLADEIREELIQIGQTCGGHLASNLGVVELTLAIHSVFDSPIDKTVWDTSHQCYVHKMLTGRLDKMYSIRQNGGLSGFAKISESEHDMFGAGHASTALSAALGIAQARDIKKENFSVISVIGDSTLTGGMAFEALNNIKYLKSNFICILNDNNMAISRPVGNMADYMTRLRTSPGYGVLKDKFESVFDRIPRIGTPLKRRIEKAVERMRSIVLDFKVGVIFEEFGFKYLGPIDGHNISMVMAALKFAKNYDGPIMIHMITKKGKGHTPAEENPIKYHGVSPKKKVSVVETKPMKPTKSYSEVLGDAVCELADEDPSIVVVTPAMKEGSGLTKFADQFPDRFFDVGIAEEHAVTFCAGLAFQGIKPILSIYSTFLQRGFDQIIHDVCLQKLPVIFTLDRSGLVGEDGPTHHGVFDIAFLLMIPSLILLAPRDGQDLKSMVKWAAKQSIATFVRFPKGTLEDRPIEIDDTASDKSQILVESGPEIVVLSIGSMVWPAYKAAIALKAKGINCTVVDLKCLKPLDKETLLPLLEKARDCLVIEEGVSIGGVASYIRQVFIDLPIRWHELGIGDEFVSHGKIDYLRGNLGLSESGIQKKIEDVFFCQKQPNKKSKNLEFVS